MRRVRTASNAMIATAMLLAIACGGKNSESGGSGVDSGAKGNGGSGGHGDTGGNSDSGGGVPVGELASQTVGVAPLAVFFDAVGAPDVVRPEEVDGHREFADFEYIWDFDDPAGTWVASGKSKSADRGYVAAHVFEQPGMYQVRLMVRDATRSEHTYTTTIIVEDPDSYYAGANTTCISATAAFDDCPAGAGQRTLTDLGELQALLASDRRLLFRRGDTWSTTAALWVNGVSDLTLGAYGPCASPDARGICSNAPHITVASNSGEEIVGGLFGLLDVRDLRVMDLHITGGHGRHTAIGGDIGIDGALHLRLRTEGFNTPIGTSHWETRGHDRYAVVDSDLSEAESNVLYTGSQRLMLLGNHFSNALDSHVVRVWQAYRAVIAHNDVSGSSINSETGRHALKLHGPSIDKLADPGPAGLGFPTRFVRVADNVFGSSGPWPVGIGPQDSGADERLSDIVFENNRLLPDHGQPSCCSLPVSVALHVWATHVTVRNNVFAGTGAGSYYTAVNVTQRGVEPAPEHVRVFNNTIYRLELASGYTTYTGINVGDAASGTEIRNNLILLAAGAEELSGITNDGTGTVESNNLILDVNILVDPDNPDPLARDFQAQESSAAVDTGIQVPVFVDFAGTPRPAGSQYDVGAYER